MFLAAAPTAWRRRASLAAALLAMVLQLMFPAGFMAADPGEAHGLPIVICSAQGSTVVDWDLTGGAHKQKAPQKSSADCAFAGHALASAPPPAAPVATPVAFEAAPSAARPYAVFPGRGLAAPPPPAIGPPASA